MTLRRDESLEAALARAVDVEALAHVEQLETRLLADGTLATVYLGLVRAGVELAGDWRPAAELDSELVAAAQARLRAKLSYTNLGFALAPEVFTVSELREVYVAALGYDVSATNLQRVLLRRGAIERVEGQRAPGRTRRPPRRVVPVRVAPARGDRRVRGAQAAALARISRQRANRSWCVPSTSRSSAFGSRSA